MQMLNDPARPIHWAHRAWERDRLIERVLEERPRWYEQKLLSRLVEDENGCQIWQGHRQSGGYGAVALPSDIVWGLTGPMKSGIHRVRWLAERGPLALGWVPDHLCKVTSCGNIEHLEAVPNLTNVMRGESFPAQNARVTQYKVGLAQAHIAHVLQVEGRRQTGMTQKQFIATHGRSLKALIDAIGGSAEAIEAVRTKAQPEAVQVVALESGIWADFAKLCDSTHTTVT